MMSMNFFELLGVSSDQLADAMPEKIVEAFHTGGKEAVREVVYNEVALKLRAPLHVRAAEPGGGEAVYGGEQPGRPVFLVKDSKDLFTRVHEDGSPFLPKEEPYGGPVPGGLGGGAPGGPPRARKPRPSGGMGGGATQRDKERDATWEAKYQNLLSFVRNHGHRPRRTGEDKERQMCFWLAQQQRKMKDGSLTDDKRERLMVVLAVKGPAARAGGTHSGGGRGGGGSGDGDDGDGGYGDGDDGADGDARDGGYGDDDDGGGDDGLGDDGDGDGMGGGDGTGDDGGDTGGGNDEDMGPGPAGGEGGQ
ncbi:MAG: hypothetical protein J3K34DRAFT_395163 [Monoraphidium minutum]|nr:MAG: hypothetical protein J3K34DRAFT_395163 [Monoraphidium minutum]